MADDARIILDAGKGQVRKWDHLPVVAVVYVDTFERQVLEDLLARIAITTGLGPSEVPVRYINLTNRTQLIYNSTHFKLPGDKDQSGSGYGRLVVNGTDDIRADLLIFSLSRPEAVYVSALTQIGGSGSLRWFAEGRNPCLYDARSRNDEILQATILISADLPPEEHSECIYEEVIQAFGLLNDSQDTPYFTLDDLAGVVEKNYDFELLSALYDPSVPMGGLATDVVQIFLDRIYPDNRP